MYTYTIESIWPLVVVLGSYVQGFVVIVAAIAVVGWVSVKILPILRSL